MLVIYFKNEESGSFYDTIGTAMILLLMLNISFNFMTTMVSFIKGLFSLIAHICHKKKDHKGSKYRA